MSQQPEHDCEFFLVTDVAVHACECDHILVSDNNTQKEYVPIEKYASLQKQLEEQKKRYDDAIERNIDKRERIAELEEAHQKIVGIHGESGRKETTYGDTKYNSVAVAFGYNLCLGNVQSISRKALQSPTGESEKENNNP